ncbi:Protein-S-isoprenylcysteine O-methyltransferase Ste14 [Singulisphaera sp. GP187]|uniref:methyltransferase family protein n=1 Tax=Singulisphaera sp. GP187 TaxID=1882752 RepID=UPI000925AEC7|nr:isoprenylcysteine carboxylmethyltransferase family protein [Singulisphaera sp. GP187]SIO66016.1 Protein-S-isoprenylcysteine O-methyltransferase Ste14 [Singulisphaera sp. GP187]
MSSEFSFQMAVGGLIALFLPVGVYHRLRAATGEPLRRRDEGLFILIALRLSGLLGMLAIVAYLFAPRRLAWSQIELPTWLRWVGLPIGLVAGVWLFWVLHTLGPNLTDTVTVRAHATLVTHGPYRWVRHPFYLAALLIILSFSLLTASLWVAIVGGVALTLLIVRSRTEEAQLEARFGAAYRAYRDRTGFLFPRLHASS